MHTKNYEWTELAFRCYGRTRRTIMRLWQFCSTSGSNPVLNHHILLWVRLLFMYMVIWEIIQFLFCVAQSKVNSLDWKFVFERLEKQHNQQTKMIDFWNKILSKYIIRIDHHNLYLPQIVSTQTVYSIRNFSLFNLLLCFVISICFYNAHLVEAWLTHAISSAF